MKGKIYCCAHLFLPQYILLTVNFTAFLFTRSFSTDAPIDKAFIVTNFRATGLWFL